MRIDRLDLIAFGHFSEHTLDLSAGTCGLHVIYGDNEAGKSTSLRALTAWLFGIPARTGDNYRHSNAQLRVGGKLRLSGGEAIEFTRRKGTKGTLLQFGTDNPLDDSALIPFLPGGIDEALFKTLYGIDHSGLVSGGQELLNQSGDLGQALFSAAIGTSNLGRILADLQDRATEVFKPRASTKLVNQAIADFREAQRRIKEASLPVADWKKLQRELADTQSAIQEVEKDIVLKSKEKSRLDRLNRVKGALAERRAAVARLEELDHVVLLPEDFEATRKMAADTLHRTLVTRERAETKLVRLTQEQQSLVVRQDLLDNHKTIQDIYKQLGAVEKAVEDRPQQDGKRRQLRNEAQQILKSVQPGLEIDTADQLRPLTNNKNWLSGLALQYGLLHQEKKKTQVAMRDIQEEQESIGRDLENQGQPKGDLGELKAVVAAARKEGDIEARLAKSHKRATAEQAACRKELARLGRFTGTLEALATAALPVTETLDSFEKRLERWSEHSRDNERRHQECSQALSQAEEDLRSLLSRDNVPSIQELDETRHDRNTGWTLIKEKYIQQLDVTQAILQYAADADLAGVYEQKVERADHISDRLRGAADQVVKRADLEIRIHSLRSRLADIVQDMEKTGLELNRLDQAWESIWEPLEIQAGTPREMKQWLLQVDKLLTKAQSAETFMGDAEQLQERCETHKQSVGRQVSLFESSLDTRTMSLEAMINLCEQGTAQEVALLEHKRRLEHSRQENQARMKRIREELSFIENDQANWQQEWEQAVTGLGLTPDVHPEQATVIFDQLLAFFGKYDQSEDLRRRIYGIDQVSKNFETTVFEFADRLGLARDGQTAGAIALQLNQDLIEAREAQASLKKIIAQEKDIQQENEDADITIRTTQDQLAALRNQAQVESDQELEQSGRRSQHKRDCLKEIQGLEQELSRNGDGLSIPELEREAAETEADSIEGQLEGESSALQELQERRDQLRDQHQTLENEIQARDGQSEAARASEEAEQHLASIASGVEQYLRLQIAALILKERIEGFRKKNQAPVLARAGQLFSRLTLGSFFYLRDELNEQDKPILLGVRPDEGEVTLDGMSDGTRDQLYLALRIATLEQHLSRGEPMPFVVDDILIGFDDRRTSVSLEILAELALRTQVLLFTHHSRVLELANGLLAEAGIFHHELA